MKHLTPKQSQFVDEYLIDLCATQAAIRAGYSRRTASEIGRENLGKPEIAAAVQQGMRMRAERTAVTQERVIAELAAVAFANIGDMLDENGSVKPLARMPLHASAAIASFDEADVVAKGRAVGKRRRVRLHDKLAALTLLARYLGMDGKTKQNDDEDPIARLIRHAQGTTLMPAPRSQIIDI